MQESGKIHIKKHTPANTNIHVITHKNTRMSTNTFTYKDIYTLTHTNTDSYYISLPSHIYRTFNSHHITEYKSNGKHL